MAPALTQTTEPPNLADATRQSPPPNPGRRVSSPYDDLKDLQRIKCAQTANTIFESERLFFTNGDRVPSGLAPPAFGWAEGRPTPNTSPCRSNMDDQPPLPFCDSGNVCTNSTQLPVSEPSSSAEANMGLQTCITNVNAASELPDKATEVATAAPHEESNAIINNQNELLALVGRDFDNVNDIIDTLQRLASNPELLDAAARDLEPETPPTHAPPSGVQTPEDRAANLLVRLAERQRQLERRRIFLLRRLRRVTARGLGMTVSSQLGHLISNTRTVLQEERTKQKTELNKEVDKPIGLEALHTESMKSMLTSDLISLVRRVEASQNLQRLNAEATRQSQANEAMTLPSSLCAQIDTVATEMRAAAVGHGHHDSDDTESSSGGESCDESEAFHNINTNYKPIRERAFYRYCRTRGWVASKWMWLQAQIADLDYKILQQQKLYMHIQATKGPVQLAEENSNCKGRIAVRNPAHLDMQDPALTCIASTPSIRTTINGYHPPNKTDDSSLYGLSSIISESENDCARTLGVQKVKRRRYVRPNMILKRNNGLGLGGTYNNSKKLKGKVSSVPCNCVPPLTCIICDKSLSGKNNIISFGNHLVCSSKLESLALLNQPLSEKLSKIDQAFHPVLSRHSDMLQVERYNSVLKSHGWQQKSLLQKPLLKKEADVSYRNDQLEPLLKKKKREREHKRNGRKYKEDRKERITLKFKKSVLTETLVGDRDGRDEKQKENEAQDSLASSRQSQSLPEVEEEELNGWQVSLVGSTNSSPCSSPAPIEKLESKGEKSSINSGGKLLNQIEGKVNRKHPGTRLKQNSTSNSYDINNIVIPYSMAAVTRVECIQYKEIMTPKWRVEEILPLSLLSPSEDFEEDVSDEAITSRHSRSEEMERKKFVHYLQHPQVNSTRSSRSRRTDSSGTNTPDHPLSPRPLELVEHSPIGSPPDTPQMGPSEDSNNSYTSASANQATVLTLSLSSLQSSLLRSNNHHSSVHEHVNKQEVPPLSNPEDSEFCDLVNSQSSKSNMNEGKPALRARRLLSANGNDKIRTVSISSLCEELNENDRKSPFPCRDFPLNENEYQDLVCENSFDSLPSTKSTSSNPVGVRPAVISSPPQSPAVGIPIHHISTEDILTNISVGGKEESGRDSPLSELTDSALEEEGPWDDDASPDWTISAVHDHSGGFVLQVQRN